MGGRINPIDEYLATLTSPRTAERYRAALSEFADWYTQTTGASVDWNLLTTVEVKDYTAYLQTVRRLSPASVNLRLAALRSFLRHLGRTLKVKGPKQVTPPVKALSDRELGRLLAAAEGSTRDTAILNLLARTGLRVGEVVHLRVGDVEMNGRSGWLTVRGGKGNKTRHVPLNGEVRQALKAWLDERPQGAGDDLFLSRTGKPLSERDVQRMVAEYARIAAVEATPHTLRHTFATRAIEKGVDVATLAAILGHSRLETTGRYLHPTAERIQEAVEGI
ncbi:site-specific recombinase XerD [Bellilinea caldifistulae]|uniref:tyrosine-type recombinase/integrase n=1 Tax=Bellilinea caldifistulae TaxID=360411 RepID=UPI000784C375|nr:tyrosine-type recombinase/integrase [Bellilinea caldifistulae]GAP09646.1 site-specific recombinase XerD [Bellilinea caldifistulae]